MERCFFSVNSSLYYFIFFLITILQKNWSLFYDICLAYIFMLQELVTKVNQINFSNKLDNAKWWVEIEFE